MEHCIVEYGGQTNNANIYSYNAKPTLQYNTIRNSSHSGIYVNGTGSNGVPIKCNNLKDNYYGIYVAGGALPTIQNNNFLDSRNYGIYNAGAAIVAENNWWGDASGPGYNGDAKYGSVDFTPFLTEPSTCVNAPPTNSPPFVPGNPNPANNAVRIPVAVDGAPVNVNLAWSGGDPNPWDAVVYDVYLGLDSENLAKVAENLSTRSHALSDLEAGKTYYWKIIARDDVLAETSGPVWYFTTLGEPPDLAVSSVTWDLTAPVSAGQTFTFTAVVQNTGVGPVVDGFQTAFKVDGSIINTKTVSPVIQSGQSVSLTCTWNATPGDHIIKVEADINDVVVETDGSNNCLSLNLPMVLDKTPPALLSTTPVNGAYIKESSGISFSLDDPYGEVDDASVISSLQVRNSANDLIAGTVMESNDTFSFTPDSIPLASDTYSVSFTASDNSGNSSSFNFSFTTDGQPPAVPAITGGNLLTGVIQVRPFVNHSNTATVTLSGTREDNTSLWINNASKVALGSGNWQISFPLSQGDNALEIWLQDRAGNKSESIWLDVKVDSVVPVISSVAPANNAFLNAVPGNITVNFQEQTSGIDLPNSLLTIKDASQVLVPGDWTIPQTGQLLFTPTAPFVDSSYGVSLLLKDMFGNVSSAFASNFVVDTAAPASPVVNPVTSPCYTPTQVISGTKEAYASILINNLEMISHTSQTTWSYTTVLVSGENQIVFNAKDRAGNISGPSTVTIVYDDIPPVPVANLSANGSGDGTTVTLSWAGYNETGQGDIQSYRVYQQEASFGDVAGMPVLATVPAGTFSYQATGLTKGNTYWFAVVPVDAMGHADNTVICVSAIPEDTKPPENVTSIIATSYEDRLVFSWTHSANTGNDLDQYKIVFNGAAEPVLLDKAINEYEATGLTASTGYSISIYAVDLDGNTSSGASLNAATLLNNPVNLAATPHDGYVDLSWSGVTPSNLVKNYRVYISVTPGLADVTAMTFKQTATGATAKVTGLTNHTPYYFAVTTVNISNGERKDVSPVSATPVPDEEGPAITGITYEGAPVADGFMMTKSGNLTLAASDAAGISHVEFYLNGSLMRSDFSSPYTCYMDIFNLTDGTYSVLFKVYDTFGNATERSHSIQIAMAPPAAPVITYPSGDMITNTTQFMVSGNAEKGATVTLYNNDVENNHITAGSSGYFCVAANLAEGENRLKASAANRGGAGPFSAVKTVTLDTTLPGKPAGFNAQSKAAGQIKLAWQAPANTQVKGYNIYRASSSFTTIAGALKITTNPYAGTSYTALPATDGTWYYRIATVDMADNESELSDEASAVSDRTLPHASIVYSPQGKFDAGTQTMGPGRVDLVLTVNEPLAATPFLSITPEGGIPVTLELQKDSDLEYSGSFDIADSTITGTAWAVFSARDMVGNRGTDLDAGESIRIDTDGPSIRRIALSPLDPVKNNETEPVTISFVVGLNEAVKTGTQPELSCRLSLSGPDAVSAGVLVETTPEAGEAQAWQGQFTLASNAGLAGAETLSFIYTGVDFLDNTSSEIFCKNAFQVYQGDLPPLEAPDGLTGEALPGGQIHLVWNDVENAAGYQLYRKGPSETDLAPLGDFLAAGEGEFTDSPETEGVYDYAVASIREINGEQSLSGLSATVTVSSDATAPPAPTVFKLELAKNGIVAMWTKPDYTENATYSLYRSNTAEITTIEGLSPVISGIPMDITQVVDTHPSVTHHCYAVTAVDEAGNESLPSNDFYLNFTLLPVSGMTVTRTDDSDPVITWTHPDTSGNIIGYDFSINGFDPERVTEKTYTDTGYGEDVRTYAVTAVDQANAKSLARTVTLPMLRTSLGEGAVLERGIMNRVPFSVENTSSATVENIRLKVRVGEKDHMSPEFSAPAHSEQMVFVVIGGYDNLLDSSGLKITTEINPPTGENVRIVKNTAIDVIDGSLALEILNDEFIRGGTGQVKFTIDNTGEETIEIITARGFGNQNSSDVRFELLDMDGNVLTVTPLKQAVGQSLVTLSNGDTVARIPAGDAFTSNSLELKVPANAPDNLKIRLRMGHIYYHSGQSEQITMQGLSTTRDVTLTETSYYARITSILPETTTGGNPVTINGEAIERSTGNPLAGVAIKLILSVNGFERTFDVLTNETGQFTHAFIPGANESGIYKVMALHPDLTDRTVQGQFVISSIVVSPSVINVQIPKNYEQTIKIEATAGKGTTAENLRVVYEAENQPEGLLLNGVHVTLGAPVNISSEQKIAFQVKLWGDNTAARTGKLVFKVKSGEAGENIWGTVVVNLTLVDASPVLYFSPNFVETGMARGEQVTETITLENKGLAALEGMRLSLVNQAGGDMPGWVALTSSADQGALAVGETRKINLSFFPDDTVAEGIYSFYLRVSSSNHPTRDIGIYASVTQSGVGNALFKVSDIYTGTPHPTTGLLIQGLAGAKINLQNEAVLTQIYSKITDSAGEAWFEDLPAGQYKCRITANNHQEKISRIWIRPGVAATQDVFLDYNLVTVEWEVNEVTLQDKYEIVLNATYETNVPAAVVIASPTSVNLPDMSAGDVFNGEITLTNHGLIRADHVNITLPRNNAYFKYEATDSIPASINPKESIHIPYRVTCLSAYGEEASGGGINCTPSINKARVEYDFCCALGQIIKSGVDFHFIYVSIGCSSVVDEDSSSGGIDPVRYYQGSSGGTGSTSGSPAVSAIQGTKCYPKNEKEECETCKNKASEGNQEETTGSFVNVKYRTYNRDDLDLAVKTPTGNLEIMRYYQDGQWYIGSQNYNLFRKLPGNDEGDGSGTAFRAGLEFSKYTVPGVEGEVISAIVKNGVVYELPGDRFAISTEYDASGNIVRRKLQYTGERVYQHKTYSIAFNETSGGYVWKNKNGQTHEYSVDGNLVSSGDGAGRKTAAYIYGENNRVEGIQDVNNAQVAWFEYNIQNQLVKSRLSDGRQAEYFYTDDLLTRVVDATGQETRYEYDAKKRLVKVIDPAGHEKQVTYGDQNEVLSVKDQAGVGFTFDYDYDDYKKEYYAWSRTTSGLVKEVWLDAEGHTKRVAINGRIVQKIRKEGRNEIVTDENGYETVKEYDEWDNLTKTTHPDNTTVINEYEHEHHRLIKKTDENGVITTYDYDESGNLIRKTDAKDTDEERITEYTYDESGNVLTVTVTGDPENAVTTMTYDGFGNLTSITDPEGNLTQFTEHDVMGNVLTKIDENNKTWHYAYDPAGRLLTVTDPQEHVTSFEYDAVGNKVKEIDAGGGETLFEYDSRNNLVKTIRVMDAAHPENNPVTVFEYNQDNRMIRQVDPEGHEVIYEYDNEGRLLKTIDGNGNEISMEYSGVNDCSSCSGGGSGQLSRVIYPTFQKTFVYDKVGRKVSEDDILDAENSYRSLFRYDPAGNLVSKTDKEGKTTYYDYDALSRLVSVTDPEAGETRYAYDDRDNMVSLTDAEGNVTRFQYNKNNQLVKEIRPLLQETLYVYDGAGNLIEKIDAKNQKNTYGYDDTGKLTEIKYFAMSTDTVPVKTVAFTYDAIGNLTGYNDGTTSAAYGYDALYQKVSESVNYGPFTKTNAYTYLKNGLKQTFTGPDAISYGYLYDQNNQLTGVQVPNLGYITINDYTWNRPASMTLPGGTTRDFSYDPLMRIKQITSKDPGANVMLNYQYDYDKMDNITAKATEHGPYAYGYDDLYRLTDVDNPAIEDEGFTYDLVGNRLTAANTTGNWAYNDNNELLTSPALTGQPDSAVLEYDANGNTIKKTVGSVVTSYVYNLEDRLTQIWNGEVSTGSLTAQYYYDPFGRRLWKEVAGVRTYFLYSDEGLTAEIDATGTVTKTYGYKPGSTWTTDPLFMKVGTEYYFYHTDHLGTPQKMTGTNGAVVWSAKYSSFGLATVEIGTVENNLRFPGQYYDGESGLHYNFWRYYDPSIGRYCKTDTLGVAAGINVYLYVMNNTLIYTDPSGEIFLPGILIGAGSEILIQIGTQLVANGGRWECIKIDWTDVIISGAIGGFAPGLFSVGKKFVGLAKNFKKIKKARKVIATKRHRAFEKLANGKPKPPKYERRLHRNTKRVEDEVDDFADTVKTLTGYQILKTVLKSLSDAANGTKSSSKCPCPN
jgi:RHS repeat-associated protein